MAAEMLFNQTARTKAAIKAYNFALRQISEGYGIRVEEVLKHPEHEAIKPLDSWRITYWKLENSDHIEIRDFEY